MANAYERLPVPGFTSPTASSTDPELLHSFVGFVPNGVTLAGGQGILPAGTVLGMKTSDKKYYVYDNGASDGVQTARGVLLKTADTGSAGSADQLGNIVIQGILKLDQVSGADSNALVDLGAVTDSVRNTFKF